jgi:hypothetical protein
VSGVGTASLRWASGKTGIKDTAQNSKNRFMVKTPSYYPLSASNADWA